MKNSPRESHLGKERGSEYREQNRKTSPDQNDTRIVNG